MSTLPKTFISEEKYLELDRAAEYKSEYYDGEMFAMAGAGMAHNQIVVNTASGLHSQLRGKPCQALTSDMRTRIGSAARYAYRMFPSFAASLRSWTTARTSSSTQPSSSKCCRPPRPISTAASSS